MKTHPFFVLIGITVFVMAACGGGLSPTPTVPPKQSPTPPCAPASPGAVGVNLEDPGGSGEYMFDSSEFSFDVGETVTFSLCAETEFHTFTVRLLFFAGRAPGRESIPGRDALFRPVGNIDQDIIIVKIARPNREAKIVTD